MGCLWLVNMCFVTDLLSHFSSEFLCSSVFLQEICENAVFVEGSTGTTDICQGQLGESVFYLSTILSILSS